MAKTGYFIWSFNYLNGRRAIQGNVSTSEEYAFQMASELSRKKNRVIVLKGVVNTYGRYGNTNMATGSKYIEVARFKNGKVA